MSVTFEIPRRQFPARPVVRRSLREFDELLAVLERVQTSDVQAFAQLVSCTERLLLARARGIVRNNADAEDVVSCVYHQAWATSRSYDSARGSVRNWLNTICRSRSLDLLRRRHAHNALSEVLASSSDSSVSASSESQIDCLQQTAALHEALGALSPMRRYLLHLSFFRELTHSEISTMLGLPLGTVKSQLRRTLITLRQPLSCSVRLCVSRNAVTHWRAC
jgi:RNA polymerase sigma-70 factor, ECF subfamily